MLEPSGQRLAAVVSTDQGPDLGHWPHTVLFNVGGDTGSGPSLPMELTRGLMSVVRILSWDSAGHM